MIKLIRNCLGSQKVLQDINKQTINWEYIVKLVDLQYSEGLHAATKLKKRHIQWAKEKMRVKIATQTLSKSVADALLYLAQDLKLDSFQGVEATSKFIHIFNNLFDIFNSRNRFAKYFYKKPLSPATEQQFFVYLDDIISYIINLSLGGCPVSQSSRKTGFLGFLICIESLKQFYQTFVISKKYLKYVLTYKLSQDHLELFFGAIRSLGGFNNNPTARQLEAAYKSLIVRSQIKAGDTGNVVNLDAIPILFCSSSKLTINDNGDDLQQTNDYILYNEKLLHDIDQLDYVHSPSWALTDYVLDIVSYIAGYVVRGLKKIVTCSKCLKFLESETSLSNLQKRKEYKNLINSSAMVVEICRAGEKYFRFFNKTNNMFNREIKNLIQILIVNTQNNISVNVFKYFGEHLYDDDPVDSHADQLIKLILKQYFKIRIHHETNKKLDITTTRIRSVLTKTVLFKNQ